MPDAYQVSQQWTDVNGVVREGAPVTDARLEAEVVKAAQKDAVEPKAPTRRRKSLTERLRYAEADLRHFAEAWNTAAYEARSAELSVPLKSPAGRRQPVEYLYPSPFARRKPAESRVPVVGDPRLRESAITAAQRLADAIRVLMTWDWDSTAWHPHGLAYTRVRDGRTLVMCDADGAVCWRDPDSMDTPLPDNVDDGVSQLRGMLAKLSPIDWEDADEMDRDVLSECLTALEAGKGALLSAGAWGTQMPAEVSVLCSRDGCWNEVRNRAGGVCASCTSKEYRQRKKAS